MMLLALFGAAPRCARAPSAPVAALARQLSAPAPGVAVARAAACVVLADGRLRCSGRYGAGETVVERDARLVATGDGFSCAAMRDGSVRCWGAMTDDAAPPSISPRAVEPLEGPTQVVELLSGASSICARSQRGEVWCAKGSSVDAATLGARAARPTAWAVVNGGAAALHWLRDSSVLAIERGDRSYVAARLAPGGSERPRVLRGVRSVDQWARGFGGVACVRMGGAVACFDEAGEVHRVDGISDAAELIASARLACVRHAAGGVSCWSIADDRVLAGLEPTRRWGATPMRVETLDRATSLAALEHTACATLAPRGTVRCIRAERDFSVGGAGWQAPTRFRSVDVSSIEGAASLVPLANGSWLCADTGRCFSLSAMSERGARGDSISSVTRAEAEQRGLGDESRPASAQDCRTGEGGSVRCFPGIAWDTVEMLGAPERLGARVAGVGDEAVRSVALDERDGGCAVMARDGSVRCWTNGGDARPVRALSGVAEVAMGATTICARTEAGAVTCWGDGSFGQRGDGALGHRAEPGPRTIERGAVQLVGGYAHFCARLDDGGVRCWGWNGSGQLGDGTRESSARPVAASNLRDAVQLRSGRTHVCAIDAARDVRCWGAYDGLERASLSSVALNVPQRIDVGRGAVDVALSELGTVILRADRSLVDSSDPEGLLGR
jgi:hypothetical protein